jgi:hypothetical protein
VLIQEILYESLVVDEIKNDLMDFLVTYRNKNRPWAPMSGPNGAVAYLRKMHHDVNASGLMNLLAEPPFTDIVERSGPDHIKLKTHVPDQMSDKEKEKEAQKINQTAQTTADKAVKSGNLSLQEQEG